MVTKEQIDRINELARKAKSEGLTEAETAERDKLRRIYIDSFKANLRAQLDRIEVVGEKVEKDASAKNPSGTEIKKDLKELEKDMEDAAAEIREAEEKLES